MDSYLSLVFFTKYISGIPNGSIKSSRRLRYLRRFFPTTNQISSNSSKEELCSFPQTSCVT